MEGGTKSEPTSEGAARAGQASAADMGQASAPESRCGYVYEASTVTGLGAICCWREVWGEEDRCIWHADVAQKPTWVLESAAPDIGERIDGAIFRDVKLSGTDWLAGRTIAGAQFVNTNLDHADLTGTDLRHAHFEEVDAQHATLRATNLEHAEFDRTDLRGASLCEARLHYAVFDRVRIAESTAFGDDVVYAEQMTELDDEDDRRKLYEATHWSYREIQQVAEANGLTRTARTYYLKRKDVRRREAWDMGSYPRALIKEVWRWTTSYGSSPWRVIGTSLSIILLCAVLYPLVGQIHDATPSGTPVQYYFDPSAGLAYNIVVFLQSLYFSTVTFATLGFGDIQPVFLLARVVAGVEALLGQLLMALLVFVLTRNVTWSE